jgi:hypothetical protein
MTKDEKYTEYRYANWLSQMIAYAAPAHLQVIAGRGTSKSTQIIAERMQEVCYDMPGSLQILVCNTYTNARTNIIPAIMTGWQNYKGWIEGRDFVIGVRPPSHFKRCASVVVNYKNVISIFNGCCIVVGSLEMLSGLAGNSYQHLYGDEVKYSDKKKMDVIFPALRGNNHYPHSPYYLGTTFTTDLPDITKGNFNWIQDFSEEMDIERVEKAYYVGYEINKINKRILRALKFKNQRELENAIKSKGRWMVRHFMCRKDLSMYVTASTFSNVDVLTNNVVSNMLKTLRFEEFKQSVLSIKGTLEAGDKFYTGLNEDHFFEEENSEYSESLGLTGIPDCNVLKYHDTNRPLDCGIDFGKMISGVFGQQRGEEFICEKNIYTIVPEKTRQFANKFITFYKPHRKKVLNMYYDRSGNQYASSGRDWASHIKDCIEIDEKGNRTGWSVNLMSRGQDTIFHYQEYNLIKQILEEKTEGLPILRIDKMMCRELKSSMELSKIIEKINPKTGSKTIHKDKSSESLTNSQLPMNSTNMSDAFKYLMYREEWADIANRRVSTYNVGLAGS